MTPATGPELLWSCNSDSIRAELLDHSPSVFAEVTDQVRVWSIDARTDSFDEHGFSTENDLEPLDQTGPSRDIFFNIQQNHSMDRLRVKLATFTRIVDHYNIFPYFLQAVQGFGLRARSDTSTWNNFHLRAKDGVVQACYTLHYVESNGRPTGDPWSFRKMAVYQRHDTRTQLSAWVLIKLPVPLKARLIDKLKKLWLDTQLCHVRHLMVHIIILAYSLHGWRNYLDSLKLRMEKIEEKCLFSRADVTNPYDYAVRFSDLQSIQLLRRKLVRAMSVLESAAGVVQRIQAVLPRLLLDAIQSAPLITLRAELKDLEMEGQYYQRNVLELQQRSSDAASLLSGLLQHRNAVAMEEISVNAETERSLGQTSANNVRALTAVATLYLPASLLAGIFSTPLVQSEDSGPLVVSAEFWKFVVVLLPMLAVTFVVVDLLQTLWTVRDSKDMDDMKRRRKEGLEPKRRRPWWNFGA